MAFRTAALLAALLGIAFAAEAQTPPETPGEAVIAATRQFDISSKITGRTYRVQIALPIAPPPPGGYPTLYVLDGAGMFGTWADLARGRAAAMGIEQIRPPELFQVTLAILAIANQPTGRMRGKMRQLRLE